MKDKACGAMMGLAVGDALGAPVEFGFSSTAIREEMDRVRHFHDNSEMPKGVWTDDTAMALCLADSLLEKGGYDSYDVMEKFCQWEFSGYRSYFPMGYGVGLQTDTAITRYTEQPVVHLDDARTDSVGNGCIMRLAPVVIAGYAEGVSQILRLARLSCRETHDSIGTVAVTELMAATLYLLLSGSDKEGLLSKAEKLVTDKESVEFLEKIQDGHQRILEQKGDSLRDLGGYAADCYDIAMWGLMNFDNFQYGLLGVIGLGGDTDTNGAVYGQLAGAYYGYKVILKEWREGVYLSDEILSLAERLFKMQKCPVIRTRFEGEEGFCIKNGAALAHWDAPLRKAKPGAATGI